MRKGYKTLLKPKRRIWELDFARGVSIFFVVVYHLCFDFAVFYPSKQEYGALPYIRAAAAAFNTSIGMHFIHYSLLTVLLLTCGASCSLSRNNLKRGVLLVLYGTGANMIMSLVGQYAIFGILSCLGFAVIVYSLIDMLPQRLSKWIMLVTGTAVLVLGYLYFGTQSLGTNSTNLVEIIKSPIMYAKVALGIVRFGSDYWGFFPFAGPVLIGGFLGKIAYKKKTSLFPKLDGGWNAGFCTLGKHSLAIYLFHQPVCMAICYLIALTFGYSIIH